MTQSLELTEKSIFFQDPADRQLRLGLGYRLIFLILMTIFILFPSN